MQKQTKPLKILSFFLGLGILCTGTSISAERLSASVAKNEQIAISGVKNMPPMPAVGDQISLIGKNFGTEEDELKIVFGDKEYKPVISYGNMLELKLEKDMRSGYISIKKETEDEEGETTTIESNTFYLDLKDPTLTKIEAPDGLLSGKTLRVTGDNFGNTTFWCDTIELTAKRQNSTVVELEIPEKFLECNLIAKKSGFELDTGEELKLIPPVVVSQVDFSDDKFRVYGKGFESYEDNMDGLELVFDNNLRLKHPTYVHDGSIYFEKDTTVIPAKGSVALETGDILSPQFDYEAFNSFIKILDISNLRNLDRKVDFQVEFGGSLSDKGRAKVYVNGSKVDREGSTVESSTQPALKGEAWIQLKDWKSEIFHYEFDHGAKPIIDSIKVGNHLNFEVFGENFGNGIALMSVSTNVGDLEVDEARNTSAKLTAIVDDDDDNDEEAKVYSAPEGEFTLSVSNKWGTSNTIKFTLPIEPGTVFYTTPKITEIKVIEGLAPGRRIHILGENLLQATSAKFGEIIVPVEVISRNRLAATIPVPAAMTSKLSVINADESESNEIDYELLTADQMLDTKLQFPASNETSEIIQDDEWQNLFAFSVGNTERAFDIDLVEFNFEEKGPLPVSDLRLVDSEEKEIEDVKIDLYQKDKKIRLREIEIPVSTEPTILTLQGKIFELLEKERSFELELGNLIIENIELEKQGSTKTINFAASESSSTFCREISVNDWQTCRKRIRRAVKRADETEVDTEDDDQ